MIKLMKIPEESILSTHYRPDIESIEITLPNDADADDILDAVEHLMYACTFAKDTIDDAFISRGEEKSEERDAYKSEENEEGQILGEYADWREG